MRRLALALILVAAGATTTVAADDFPYGNTHSFAVYRNGQQIGSHTLAFQGTGQQRAVTTSIDFAVKALGLTVYRYSHRGNEVWNGSMLQSIDTKTDDNGKQFTMRARHDGNRLAVEPDERNLYPRGEPQNHGRQAWGIVRAERPGNRLAPHIAIRCGERPKYLNEIRYTLSH